MTPVPGDSFAGFFPHAPNVLKGKKRKVRDKEKSPVAPLNLSRNHEHPPSPASPKGASPPVATQDVRTSATDTNALPEQEDKASQSGDAGDLLNGVGSASSRTSTHSSVFSQPSTAAMPTQNGAGGPAVELTPATTHDSSPPDQDVSPHHEKDDYLGRRINSSGLEYSPISPRSTRAATPMFRPSPTSPQPHSSDLPAPRPGPGEVKGRKVFFDPELLDRKDPRRKNVLTERNFGQDDHLQSTPPDPRLAIPGYKSGNFNIRLQFQSNTWKFRPRPAPYSIARYPWDKELSVGSGPPTSVVVRGYDPFTPDSQLKSFFSSYGEIAEIDNKTDPATGVFLGVCSIKYRDSRGRGPIITGVEAAKRAEKGAHGHRIGIQTIKVERDAGGKKTRRLAEALSKHNREQREKEQRLEANRKPPPPPPPPSEPSETFTAPPANAPKGPSGMVAKPVEAPKPVGRLDHLVETEPILSTIKRKPYIFISGQYVPVQGTSISHLKKRLKSYGWEAVRLDATGYYVIFEDHKRGEDEALRCYREFNRRELFNYEMVMECQQYGNPSYERSPSPERKIVLKRMQEEEEQQRKEDEMDIEEERKSRAANLDPVVAAIEQLRSELRDKVMADIKTRIAAPTLHDFLDPANHVAKRRKLGIADPAQQSKPSTLFALDVDNEGVRTTTNDRRKPIYGASIARIQREELRPSNNAYLDERRQHTQGKRRRKVNVRSLHQQLQDIYGDDDSDDERRTALTKDSGERDSRAVSRMSSLPPSERDEQTPLTPRKRRRIERSQTPRDEESGDEDDAIAESALPTALLKQETEDLGDDQLTLITRKLAPENRLHKRAKVEIAARKKSKEDDRLFREQQESTPTVSGPADEILPSTEEPLAQAAKKKGKSKKKSKKQIFEEREAAKDEAVKAKAIQPAISTPEVPFVEDLEGEIPDEDEVEEERAEVEWGVSTDHPRRTVEDDFNEVMDIDAWQRLVKDDEDLDLLKEALLNQPPAPLSNTDGWAHQQKAIKALNDGKNTIQGYYVPNPTGCARTQGYEKILESEKSKYLPHRIKVAKAREQREQEDETTRSNPLVAAEATRQAKMASTATSRSNRANNRTQVKDITNAKQNLLAEGQATDAIRFNQLTKRKKLVKFNRSAIHGWGLYAEENIAASDMIIEYVGEKVRQAVANIRELRYDKQGIGSSYLFRIDDDTVVDATKKGGIARFVNHSCAPNCTAKIVRVDDEMRIAIYAKSEIKKDDELTYDYKFEREVDSDMRVPCLCGSATCKGFLN